MHNDLSNLEEFTLPSGIKVVYHHAPQPKGLATATFSAVFNAGSYFDPDEKPGLAHFCEHMLMQGTAEISGENAVFRALQSVGPEIGAATSQRRMSFGGTVLEEDFDRYIGLWGHLLSDYALNPEHLQLQKGVVTREIAETGSEPDDIFYWHGMVKVAYGDHKFSRPILGNEESVNAFTQQDVSDFLNYHITRSNMTLIYVGPHKKEQLQEILLKLDVLPEGRSHDMLPLSAYPVGNSFFKPWKLEGQNNQKCFVLIPCIEDGLKDCERNTIASELNMRLSFAIRNEGLAYSPRIHPMFDDKLRGMAIQFECNPSQITDCLRLSAQAIDDFVSSMNDDILQDGVRNMRIQYAGAVGSSRWRHAALERRLMDGRPIQPLSNLIPNKSTRVSMKMVEGFINSFRGQTASIASMGPNEDFPKAQEVCEILWKPTLTKESRPDYQAKPQ